MHNQYFLNHTFYAGFLTSSHRRIIDFDQEAYKENENTYKKYFSMTYKKLYKKCLAGEAATERVSKFE